MASKWLARRKETLQTLKRSVPERFGYPPFKQNVLKRRVPETLWYQGDGAALTTLLVIQVVTGITMTLFYSNAVDHAYESVRHITYDVPLGWLVRGIHYWSAGTMVVMLFLHLFRHLMLGGYKAPREGTWTVGVFQFFLVLTMSFTGYLLRWDERAVYALRVVLNMFHNAPFIGDELVILVQGGLDIGSTTLTRIFSVHVILVPLVLISLVGLHLYLVIIHGVSSMAEWRQPIGSAEEHKEAYEEAAKSEERGEWFHPHTVLQTGLAAFAVFSIAFLLALVAGPQELYPEGNLVERSVPVEEWWFWWYSALIALLPHTVAQAFYVAFPLFLVVTLLLLPLVDRGPNRGFKARPVWVVFVLSCTIGILVLSDLRLRSPWTGWPDSIPPPIPPGVILSENAKMGRKLFAVYGCNSCHAIASHGREVGPDLARIERRLSKFELRNFILAPPEDVPMPSYRGRMDEVDLDRVAEFVLVAQTFPRE